MISSVNISGFNVLLTPMDESRLAGVSVDTFVRYNFYEGEFNGTSFCMLESKDADYQLAPAKCKKLAERLENIVGKIVVFLFESIPFVIRKRMIEQCVYYVVPGKFANLPTLFVNAIERPQKLKKMGKLSPVAQYILLIYLQHQDLCFDSIASVQESVPFSYLQITRAITDLERFNLCTTKLISGKGKQLVFAENRKELWTKAQPFLRNPVKTRYYSDYDVQDTIGSISGVNALAHYTSLNPTKHRALAVDKNGLKKIEEQTPSLNTVEGQVSIEEWIYPPTIAAESGYVDPLSLWLTMSENDNPRIEGALEQLIDTIKW